MSSDDPTNEPAFQGGFLGLLEKVVDFFDTAERIKSVLAGLFLAVMFCLMPGTALGGGEPWYFWIGSGLIALTLSAVLAWAFFPPKTKKEERSARGKRGYNKDNLDSFH